MKCNAKQGLDIACYKYERCKEAYNCDNVPRGIREKLKLQNEEKSQERKKVSE